MKEEESDYESNYDSDESIAGSELTEESYIDSDNE